MAQCKKKRNKTITNRLLLFILLLPLNFKMSVDATKTTSLFCDISQFPAGRATVAGPFTRVLDHSFSKSPMNQNSPLATGGS